MKWFSHDNNLRNTPQFKAIMEGFGVTGYGAGVMVWEVLAQYGKEPDFRLSLKDIYDVKFWQREMKVGTAAEIIWLLAALAGCSVIDPDLYYKEQIVAAPLLKENVDDWNRRKSAKKEKAEARKQAAAATKKETP
jgi:hypothetical protein